MATRERAAHHGPRTGPDDHPAFPDTVDAVRADIARRLRELEPALEESARLHAVLRALDDDAPAPAGPTRRAPRGTRLDQLLSVVREHPGITQSEVAVLLEMTPASVYGLVRRSVLKGRIVKTDGRLRPVDAD